MLYSVQTHLIPKNLIGITTKQIEDHWNLYKGYVNQVNTLNEELTFLRKEKKENSLVYADPRRRYGFEYNGMILHEYYFGNLKTSNAQLNNGALYNTMTISFGSYEVWKTDFENTGKTRGIGWAILYYDPLITTLSNHFIAEHQNGTITGLIPLLVMDVWEHAYMVDHTASGRNEYISSFMKNIDWETVEQRFNAAQKGLLLPRF